MTKKRVLFSYPALSNEYGEIIKAKSFDDYTILALTEVKRQMGTVEDEMALPYGAI